jgi:hypothetical protein
MPERSLQAADRRSISARISTNSAALGPNTPSTPSGWRSIPAKSPGAKYEPQFGGYCAFGVSKGKHVEIDPEAFQIVGGKLLLQYSEVGRDDFNKDAAGNLKKGEDNRPKLVEKKGK